MTLSLVPPAPPTLGEVVTSLVAQLRAAQLPAMAAASTDGQYAAVIIPSRCCGRVGGQYQVHPLPGGGYRVRWQRKEWRADIVDDVDTPERAAALIVDHLAGLYP